MRLQLVVPFALCLLPVQAAHGVQPLRFMAAGFETDDPQRDCAADATTEAVLADRLRAPAGGACIPPFLFGQFQVCSGPSAPCGTGCFVPFGPTTSVSVDAVAGRIGFSDPGGGIVAQIRSQTMQPCTATFQIDVFGVLLDYTSVTDGLDGVLLGGLAGPETAFAAPPLIMGCPQLNPVMGTIAESVRVRARQAYVEATLARIGEPLDAAVCPIERP